LAERYPAARDAFRLADEVLSFPLSKVCWEGPEEELRKTVHTQPALLTHSVAAWRLMESAGIRPTWVAGHSLGEYSACVAAGALRFEDALKLVHRRGVLMYRAGIERPGAMAAILGLDRDVVTAVCGAAADAGVVQPANLNAPGQVVISGETAAVERACAIARSRGAKRTIRLEVSGAFHSPLMESAAQGLVESLDGNSFRDAEFPVVNNVEARPSQRAEEIRAALKRQLLGAVLWEDSMRFLLSSGCEGFVELGAGKVLRGLIRTLDRETPLYGVEDPETLSATLAGLGVELPAGDRG